MLVARSKKNHDTNREVLIKIALELFLENGYENTTITQIMKDANLSKGGMYHYFTSKEDVLNAVIQFGLQQEAEKLKAKVEALPVEQKLFGFAQSVDIGDFTRKLLNYSNDNQDSIVAYKVLEYNTHLLIPLLTEIIAQGVAAGIYKTANPTEVSEFCILLVRAIADTNLLPATDQAGILRRLEVFSKIIITCLEPERAHAEQLIQIFKSGMHLSDLEEDDNVE